MKSQDKIEARSKKPESRNRQKNLDSRFQIPDSKRKPSVFVGLSGGVDSAVSAALLKKEGYEVTGVFIKAWDPSSVSNDGHIKYPCTWKEDRRSAMRAAAVLDIPFITLDLEKEYKEEVVDYMLREYKLGRTPNPDVMCNKEIKFGHFLKFALKNGVDFVATGHYARKLDTKPHGKNSLKKSSGSLAPLGQTFLKNFSVGLLEGVDKNKDQSYFLWTLTQEQLARTLFPIGHLEKEEVRRLAKKFKLPQATRKDSQGLCFLGKIDMKDFLKNYLKPEKGDVLNEKGEVVGEHDGAVLYTLGERHGFRVFNEKTNSEPLYVVAKNIEKNVIVVALKSSPSKSPRVPSLRSARLFSEDFSRQYQSISIKNQNWIEKEAPRGQIECRIRYRGEKIKCKVVGDNVVFKEPQLMASGQSVVFYSSMDKLGQSEICLGGAIMA